MLWEKKQKLSKYINTKKILSFLLLRETSPLRKFIEEDGYEINKNNYIKNSKGK